MPRRAVVAHRGDRSRAPDNSLKALELAIDAGADMVEVDVRRTADGVCVLCHDDIVSDIPASACGPDIPRLSEALRLLAGRIQIDVELKESGYEPQVLQELRDSPVDREDVVISSFLPSALGAVRAGDAAVVTGLITAGFLGATITAGEPTYDFLAPHLDLVDDAFLKQATAARLPLLVWTVNDPDQLTRLFKQPIVWGVVTDDPVAAIAVRNQLQPARPSSRESD